MSLDNESSDIVNLDNESTFDQDSYFAVLEESTTACKTLIFFS